MLDLALKRRRKNLQWRNFNRFPKSNNLPGSPGRLHPQGVASAYKRKRLQLQAHLHVRTPRRNQNLCQSL